MRLLPIVLVTQILLVNFCVCWWDTGHMLVAKVAELTLQEEENESFLLAEKITNILNSFSHNQITNFVESACWPDDVKKYGLQSLDEWHFLDVPVRIGDGESLEKGITFSDHDALGTIHQCYKILTKWSTEEVENFTGQFEKSMMARYLVHVVGDVHQPLHASALFDDQKFPHGDQGGNLFKIQYNDNISNLHKLFDSGADRLNNEITRPLSQADSDYLETTAKEIMNEFKKGDLPELQNFDFSDWIQESHDISQNFIYKGIQYDTRPSEDFLNSAFSMIKRRIALGGYRLADLFMKVRKAYENPSHPYSQSDLFSDHFLNAGNLQ